MKNRREKKEEQKEKRAQRGTSPEMGQRMIDFFFKKIQAQKNRF